MYTQVVYMYVLYARTCTCTCKSSFMMYTLWELDMCSLPTNLRKFFPRNFQYYSWLHCRRSILLYQPLSTHLAWIDFLYKEAGNSMYMYTYAAVGTKHRNSHFYGLISVTQDIFSPTCICMHVHTSGTCVVCMYIHTCVHCVHVSHLLWCGCERSPNFSPLFFSLLHHERRVSWWCVWWGGEGAGNFFQRKDAGWYNNNW